MKKFVVLCAGLVTLAGCSGGGSMATTSEKPEDTVAKFIDAVDKKDAKAAFACVLAGDASAAPADDMLKSVPIEMHASNYSVKMKEPYLAVVSYSLDSKSMNMGATPNTTGPDSVMVVLTGGHWKIVPGMFSMATERASVGMMAGLLGMAPVFTQAKEAAKKTASLSNAKQIATAIEIYTADYDDMFPLQNSDFGSVMPYLKNKNILTAPDDPAGTISYSFNEKLFKTAQTAVASPATTVMIYEGHDHKLNFVHQGKAAVAFCDGHAKMVDATEAASLNWDPTKS